MKIVIVGAVAGGASAAARARRLDEDSEIILFERGEEPSFANCGLPYYVGGAIASRDKLLVAPIEMLRQRYRLDVRTRSEVTSIDRQQKCVSLRNLASQQCYTESYDKLIIATGASPWRPPIPGIDSPRVMELRDLADADRLHSRVSGQPGKAIVVGAGFIGIEVTENLVRRGWDVTVVELADQILPPWDAEMVRPLEAVLKEHGVEVRLGDSVQKFNTFDEGIRVSLQSGIEIEAAFALVSIGVRPESRLAVEAGIACAAKGGIVTNAQMQTSDPDIYAVGDVAQVVDFVSGLPIQIPLAGPANRQGRIAANHIFGHDTCYRGTQGTAIVGLFGRTVAMTGHSEKSLRRLNLPYQKVYLHPNDHAGYYPGAQAMTLKALFDPVDGTILGAQGVGAAGVDKRIDVIALAIQGRMTVYDLEEAELCYAPQYGSAKDPINMVGFVAAAVLRGEQPICHSDQLADRRHTDNWFMLDVRTPDEFHAGHIPDATNIPLELLRDSLDVLPKDRKIVAYCKVGQRGYMATRLLMQKGFDAVNLSGGFLTWRQTHT